LTGAQSADGSWHQSNVETIARLFGLHLTVREASAQISPALNWLFQKIDRWATEKRFDNKVDIIEESLVGLPFIRGRRDTFLMGAVLFLASIFNRYNDPFILESYHWLSALGLKNNGIWVDIPSSHNIFRALVVHPVYLHDPATIHFIEYLEKIQTASGDWGDGLPFYQVLNALAHSDEPAAEKQLGKAFERLFQTQKADGSWGEAEAEWNTFLAVHALKNKGIL